MKLLGIDYGKKRIGLAISDDTGQIAKALSPLKVNSVSDAVAKVHRITSSQKVKRIIVGLPLGTRGNETQQSIKTRYFADALKNTNGVAVEYWNEAFTTSSAAKHIGRGKKTKKKKLDSEAARIILQEYLDFTNELEKKTAFLPQYQQSLSKR
jgi:putative Holliday junction resolvase